MISLSNDILAEIDRLHRDYPVEIRIVEGVIPVQLGATEVETRFGRRRVLRWTLTLRDRWGSVTGFLRLSTWDGVPFKDKSLTMVLAAFESWLRRHMASEAKKAL